MLTRLLSSGERSRPSAQLGHGREQAEKISTRVALLRKLCYKQFVCLLRFRKSMSLFLRNRITKQPIVAAFLAMAASTVQLPAVAANLVTNGDFENSFSNSGHEATNGIGHIDQVVTLPGWTKTCLLQCGGIQNQATSYGFAFVADDKAATRPGGGFTRPVSIPPLNKFISGVLTTPLARPTMASPEAQMVASLSPSMVISAARSYLKL